MYQYPDYLMHYGVLGMKWGQRHREYKSYAIEQDRRSKEQWKQTKAQVKSGKLSKKSAKYRKAKNARREYQTYVTTAKLSGGKLTKASRGKEMMNRKITAEKPKGRNTISDQYVDSLRAGMFFVNAKKALKYGRLAVGTSAVIGSVYVNNKYSKMYAEDIINLKPHQYKVRTI